MTSEGVVLISMERRRQILDERWHAAHDDQHEEGELAMAAASYAVNSSDPGGPDDRPPSTWPWELQWWKPKTPIQDLIRAGALIAAEIDRRLRKGERP